MYVESLLRVVCHLWSHDKDEDNQDSQGKWSRIIPDIKLTGLLKPVFVHFVFHRKTVSKPDCSGLKQKCTEKPQTQRREVKCTCKFVNCTKNPWTQWSATCGRATRQRTWKVRKYTPQEPLGEWWLQSLWLVKMITWPWPYRHHRILRILLYSRCCASIDTNNTRYF